MYLILPFSEFAWAGDPEYDRTSGYVSDRLGCCALQLIRLADIAYILEIRSSTRLQNF